MEESILIGRGRGTVELPRERWEEWLAEVPARAGARLRFMTEEHHLVRNFVVSELPRIAEPIPPEHVARELGLQLPRTLTILDELERHLFFLVRNQQGAVSWAFPVTVDSTGHGLSFSTGERLDAA